MPLLSIIDVSSLAGVLVFLVAMYLVRGYDFIDLPGGGVDLAVAKGGLQPGALREDALTVWVTRDDTIYFGNSKFDIGQIPEPVQGAVRHGSEAKVYLHVDARAKYGSVNALLR